MQKMSTKLDIFDSFDICHAMAHKFFERASSNRSFSHNVGRGDKHYEFNAKLYFHKNDEKFDVNEELRFLNKLFLDYGLDKYG